MKMAPVIPQPKTYGPLGNLPQIDLERPVQSLVKLAEEYGPIFKIELPGRTELMLSGHELVADACDESRFDKKVWKPLQKVRVIGGDGLFTSWTNEPNWKKAHNILLPSFSQTAMRGYHNMMVDIAMQLVQKWGRLNPGEYVEVSEDMTRLTLDTIGLCGFNYRFNSFYREQPHPFISSMVRSLGEVMGQLHRLGIQDKLMIKNKLQLQRDIQTMFTLVDAIIAERKGHPADNAEDLLAHMLNGKDPDTGEALDVENIRYQIITFLIAGHETTSGLLSFAIYYLLANPEVLRKAYEEADRVLTGPVPTYAQVRELKYIRMILNETLRLWPTAPAFSLYAKEDTTLAGKYPLKKDDSVVVLIPRLHRDRSVWGDDAEEFRPERFVDPSSIPLHAFKPFGNGQRACIGQQFAMQEATLVLGMVLKHFELIADEGYQLQVKETLTLKPEGFKMQVRPRGGASSGMFIAAATAVAEPGVSKRREAVAADAAVSAAEAGPGSLVETLHTPLLVLFGSNMGTAESLARTIGDAARSYGFAAQVAPLDRYAEAGKLPKEGAVLIVTASYNGKPPSNARQFVKWLADVPAGELEGVRYLVFGCGDRNWAKTYQHIPRWIDEQLSTKGAERLAVRGEADASADFERSVDAWSRRLWPELLHGLGLQAAVPALSHADGLLTMEWVESDGAEQPPRSVNDPQWVERALRRFGLEGNRRLILHGADLPGHAAGLPLERPISAYELLLRHVALQEPVTREQLRELAAFTSCPPHRKELEEMVQTGAGQLTMLELLERYPACELPFERFVALLAEKA